MNGESAAATAAVHDIIPSETLAGNAVVNRDDEELGTLAHIMLDVPGGRIAYAVLGCGGVFGIGERLHAVPWSALELDPERQCFVLDAGPWRSTSTTAYGLTGRPDQLGNAFPH